MSNGTQTDRPNLFMLMNRNLRIRYQTTSLQGEAEFQYEDGQTRVVRRGDDIRSEQTSIGELVTIVIDQVADLETVTFTLFLPTINLIERRPASVFTAGLITRYRTTIAGPGAIVGQVQTYDPEELKGTAQLVQF